MHRCVLRAAWLLLAAPHIAPICAFAFEAVDVLTPAGNGVYPADPSEALMPYSSDARERRFPDVADDVLPGRIRRLSESELRGVVFELAMEHSLLQTWTGYPKELKTACKLFGVKLKSVEMKTAKALKEVEQQKAPEATPAEEAAADA